MRVAITGGIGCGKTEVCNILSSLGAKVVSADAVNRTLLQDETYIDLIAESFAGVVENGAVNKVKLSETVFKDKDKLKKLNALAHPLIMERIKEQTMGLPLVYVEIPLLIESGASGFFDEIWLVTVAKPTQIERVIKRDNVSYAHALSVIDMQAGEDELFPLATRVITTDGTLSELELNVIDLHNEICEKIKILSEK